MRDDDVITKEGNYVIEPFYLKNVLTDREQSLLRLIRHELDLGHKYISNSLIEVELGYSKGVNIKQMKNTLVKLKFIEESYTKGDPKGTAYTVKYNVIAKFIHNINSIYDPVERLKFADDCRVSHGLPPIHESVIKKYGDTTFNHGGKKGKLSDYVDDSAPKVDVGEDERIKQILDEVDKDYERYKKDEITEHQFTLAKTKRAKAINRRIILDNEKSRWIAQ